MLVCGKTTNTMNFIFEHIRAIGFTIFIVSIICAFTFALMKAASKGAFRIEDGDTKQCEIEDHLEPEDLTDEDDFTKN